MSGINRKMSVAIITMLMVTALVTLTMGTAGNDSAGAGILTAENVTAEESVQCTSYENIVIDPVKLDIMKAPVQTTGILKKSSEVTETVSEEASEKETEKETQTETEAETETEASTEASTEAVTETEAPSPVIPLSNDDYNNLVRIVEAEATDADMKAKILVADVVINRVRSPLFPNTVSEVIFQGNGEQFQPVMDGRFYSVTVRGSTYEAVDRALYGEDYSEGATYFAAVRSAGEGSWHARNLTRLFEYGGHVFFRP